jgi:hypothetical protein
LVKIVLPASRSGVTFIAVETGDGGSVVRSVIIGTVFFWQTVMMEAAVKREINTFFMMDRQKTNCFV